MTDPDASSSESTAAGVSRRGLRSTLVRLGVSFAIGVVLLEAALHVAPGLLPAAYLDRFPAHGLEFFRPGALAEAPIDGIPVPLVPTPWIGPPPSDLIEFGIAPPEFDGDALRTPHAVVPSDARGLPNSVAHDRADVVLVGDSFLVSASAVEPRGVKVRMEEAIGRPVYSLGVAGIGPLREAWMVENVALELEPELVVWFFFGGNDLSDVKRTMEHRAAGRRSRSELPDYVAPPLFRLPGVLETLLGSDPSSTKTGAPLPPLALRGGGPEDPEPTWFHPTYLSRLAIGRREWEGHVAWTETLDAINRGRDAARRGGAEFVLVYLPSKEEVLLPFVSDVELLYRYLGYGFEGQLPLDAAASQARMLQNRRALSEAVAAFCATEDIPCWVATPVLEALVSEGESGYFAADSHWDSIGQEAVVGPLLAFLEAEGLLAP